MSRGETRGSARIILLALLALGPLLAVFPLDVTTIRLAGVSLFWWYAVVGAPAVVVAVTIAALLLARR